MDKKFNPQNWVGNMYQKFEAVCQEVDEFIHKDRVRYVESHMQTVGQNVKKFYSGVVQEILPPFPEPLPHVTQLIPLKQMDMVRESPVDNNTNQPENATLVSTEKRHEPLSSGLCHSEQISCAVSGNPIDEADANSFFQQESENKTNKTSDKAIQVHLNSSISSQEDFVVDQSPCTDVSSSKDHKDSSEAITPIGCIDEKCEDDHSAKVSCQSSENHLDNRPFEEEGILSYTSSKIDASVFEDADWGIENIFDLNLGIGEKIDGETAPCPSEDVNSSAEKILFPFVEEKCEKVLMETLVSGSANKTLFPFVEEKSEKVLMETLVSGSTDKTLFPFVKEKSEKVLMETLVSGSGITCCQEKKPLLNSSVDEFESDLNSSSELKKSIACNENEEEEAYNIFADGLLPVKLHDSSSEHDECNFAQLEAFAPCAKIGATDGSAVNVEDLNMHAVDLSDKKQVAGSCDITEDKNLFSFSYGSSRSKSYKKIIQDAFTSRKRLTKEYKQLAIWYGDIEKELSESMEENAPKSPARDSCDSEWEIL